MHEEQKRLFLYKRYIQSKALVFRMEKLFEGKIVGLEKLVMDWEIEEMTKDKNE